MKNLNLVPAKEYLAELIQISQKFLSNYDI